MLKDIVIRVYPVDERPSFYFYTGGIDSLYSESIKKVNTGVFKYINIYFTSSKEKKCKEYPDLLNVDFYFDFNALEELKDNYSKKEYILVALHNAALVLCDTYKWDNKPFQEAYNYCFSRNLDYSWFFKNKLFVSPDKKYYFGLYHHVDMKIYEIYEILYDNSKNEIARRLCFKDETPIFSIEKASWGEVGGFFWYKFKGPTKIFNVNVHDILGNIGYDLNMSSSKFFK